MKKKTRKIRTRRNRAAGQPSSRRVNRAGLGVKVLLLALLLFRTGLAAQSQQPTFRPGEEIRYGAYYNWKFFWVNAGEVHFRTDTIRVNQSKQWRLRSTGHTYRAYDLVYSVRDTFETRLTYPGFEPLYFYKGVHHGGSSSRQSYRFQPNNGTIDYFDQKDKAKPVRKKLPLQPGANDLLSQAYRFRSYAFGKLKLNEQVKFPMLADEQVSEFWFRYLGRERVKTRSGRQFDCYKVSVWLMEGEFFPEGEFMTVWFTTDKNCIPIMVETRIQFGSVKAIFLDAKSLSYPLNSEIH